MAKGTEDTEITTTNEPTMFHYLLEMHKGGKILLRLDLNVPTAAFPAVQKQSLLSMETILVEYGVQQGFVAHKELKEEEHDNLKAV